ncbi:MULTISPECIES: hypothetical protein [Pseudomonas]|uniref:Uncharacterized protein n=1 Tax=Pseudomonas syringae pv. antirrhini TaxID=251702 RepID=A0A0P9JBA3_9PSED|nr:MULTISPECIES: hypothetical protein [Pseudomonas]KPW44193.1 Uncharacterized protein ALO88_01218 [Pseudomonas syringae pv. antirrhini]MCF5031539.1 hypothetical protein [Pseudomonas syringae]POD22480.1 hypothetical protein BKM12_04205 [Pseudomonas syringae pv. syringae]RMP37208.1 hypothetical protein ALQ23_200426 [Pseudomonas syringae pv. antirrhini]RMP37279.1 hypothetical protein ALQ24_03973 [Pseudomonas syringae pv. antirrhini]
MMGFLMFAGFVVFAFTFAVGMWALGRWLRSKGYGPQLDKLDRQYTALQLRVSPLAMSASYRMFVGARALNLMPLLGSKTNANLNQQVLTAIEAARQAQLQKNPDNR